MWYSNGLARFKAQTEPITVLLTAYKACQIPTLQIEILLNTSRSLYILVITCNLGPRWIFHCKSLVSVSKVARDNDVFIEFHAYFCLIKNKHSHHTLLKGMLRNYLFSLDRVENNQKRILGVSSSNLGVNITFILKLSWCQYNNTPSGNTLAK